MTHSVNNSKLFKKVNLITKKHQLIEEFQLAKLNLSKVTLFCKHNNYDPLPIYYSNDFDTDLMQNLVKNFVKTLTQSKNVKFKGDLPNCTGFLDVFTQCNKNTTVITIVDDNKRRFELRELKNFDLAIDKLFIILDEDYDVADHLLDRSSTYLAPYEYLYQSQKHASVNIYSSGTNPNNNNNYNYYDNDADRDCMDDNQTKPNMNFNVNNGTNVSQYSEYFDVDEIRMPDESDLDQDAEYENQDLGVFYQYSSFNSEWSTHADYRIFKVINEKVYLPYHELCTMNNLLDFDMPELGTMMPFTLSPRVDMLEQPMLPSPKYIPLELLNQMLKEMWFDSYLEDWTFDSSNMLVSPDIATVTKLRNMIPAVMAQIIKNPFSISGINVSAEWNDGMSILHRVGNYFCTSPLYMNRAARASSLKDRFSWIATMFVACLNGNLMIRKPFIPFIGETVTCSFDYYNAEDDEKVHVDYFAEYVCHYPPTINLLLENKGLWRIYGSIRFYISMGFNSASTIFDGTIYIEFADGQKFTYNVPSVVFKNLLWGEFKAYLHSVDSILKLDSCNFMKLSYGHDWWNSLLIDGCLNLRVGDVDTSEKVGGEIFKEMYVGSKTYYKYRKDDWVGLYYAEDPIPSDARFREDIIYFQHGDLDKCHYWKKFITNANRYDRKFRGINI